MKMEYEYLEEEHAIILCGSEYTGLHAPAVVVKKGELSDRIRDYKTSMTKQVIEKANELGLRVLEQIYAKVNNVILPADLTPNANPPMGFVTMMLPGITVNPKDFDTATENGKRMLYQYMDRIPNVNKSFVDSTKTVSAMYPQILNAQVPKGDPDKAKAMETEYKASSAFLETEKYDKYMEYRDKYFDARDEYLCLGNEEPTVASELRKAKRAMESALEMWNTRGSKQLAEKHITVVKRYCSYTPEAVFAAAQDIYLSSKDMTDLYHVYCYPDTWAGEPEKLSCTKVIIKEGSSVGKLAISFEMARVDLVRPWFNTALLI